MQAMHAHELIVTYGTSKARDTYGYTVVTLRECGQVKARCNGGGYDMRGTVFAEWLEKEYQERLQKSLRLKTYYINRKGKPFEQRKGRDNFYGSTLNADSGVITLDGGCGTESIRRIAEAIGLQVRFIDAGKRHEIITITDKATW